MMLRLQQTISVSLLSLVALFCVSSFSWAATMNISDVPLYSAQTQPPFSLIVMGRDHKLFYEAYNDASDLDGDGTLDIRYKPSFDYYGYFDPYICYTHNGSYFTPASVSTTKTCSGQWSGNFLNYVTMSRMDAVRKVLYGGTRYIDTQTETILERAYIPQDAHSWGKEYQSIARDGYDISSVTPYGIPSSGKYHIFANTTDLNNGAQEPRLRMLINTPYRVWQYLSIERPVADTRVDIGTGGSNNYQNVSPTDLFVRVKVCDVSVKLESNCKSYHDGTTTSYKPTGLLHDYGENGAMRFGLLTGTWSNNQSGGVMRKNVSDFSDEVDASDGTYTNVNGIVKSIDKVKIANFGSSYYHFSNCGWIFNRAANPGECRDWGNPIAEMMYEAVRYYQGLGTPTSGFTYSGGDDAALGLPTVTWNDPFNDFANAKCAKPNIILISDLYPSYDSDEVPGSAFASVSGDLTPSLNVSSLADTIWASEFGGSGTFFIGESNGVYNGNPTAKTVTGFSNIRGLAPEEPTKEGSYYSASVAYYAHNNDIHAIDGDQKIKTYVIALTSPLPELTFDVGGSTVTMVPFGKTVGGCGGVSASAGAYQPTNTIVDFYVESLGANSGTFRINFEDVEQGADHDMDVIARYEYSISGGQLHLGLEREYQAGGCVQHMGYVISGTSNDGMYLDISDQSSVNYYLNTPPGTSPGAGGTLPTDTTGSPRAFTPSGSSAASLLKSPLWYAAKWGNFEDSNGNSIPDLASEWDTDGDGVPDNYFLVTNPSNLATQLSAALSNILARSTSSSAAALNSGSLSTDTRLYQAIFNTSDWEGQLLAYQIDTNSGAIDTSGTGPNGSLWDGGAMMGNISPSSRVIITYNNSSNQGVAFRWPSNPGSPSATEIDSTLVNNLIENPVTGTPGSYAEGSLRLDYIRGDNDEEVQNGGGFRNRTSDLGDIINSNPLFIGAPAFRYPDTFSGGSETSYTAFKNNYANRDPIVAVGANDGMLHIFDATSGEPVLSYIPSSVHSRLNTLTDVNYSHKYFVDGSPNQADAFFNGAWHTVLVGGLGNGGQGIYALDITDPSNFSEANAEDIVLWEFTDADTDGEDLGVTYSVPAVVRMANGQWAAIFGNGYNNTVADSNPSATGNAVLYIVDIADGSIIKKLDTGVGSADDPSASGRPNGLSTPAIVDTNGDSIADTIYVGDLFGNLWKIDISSSNDNQWDFAIKSGSTPQPLFVAENTSGDRQSITSRPNVSRLDNEVNKTQVYFGSGKYIEDSDKSNTETQSFYGIEDHDDNTTIVRGDLLVQYISTELTSGGYDYRITTDYTKSDTHDGWVLDLTSSGERVVTDPILRNRRIIFSTLIPDSDPCNFGGTGWLMELNAQDGARLGYTPFDVDGDGIFTAADYLSYGTNSVAVSGRKSTVGIIPAAGIVATVNKEYKYTPGTSGNIEKVDENIGPDMEGRQSWRQIK